MEPRKDEHIYSPEGTNNTSLNVHNTNDQLSHFFQIKVPYQITYQFCSGTTADDYMNSITLSSEKSYFLQEKYSTHKYLYHIRPLHYHDYYEFMIVLDGIVTQKIEEHEYKYPAGSCCLINRGLHHSESFETSAQILFIGLSVDFLNSLFDYCRNSSYKHERDFLDSDILTFIRNDITNPGKRSYLDFIPAYNNTHTLTDLHRLSTNLMEAILFPRFGTTYIIKGLLAHFMDCLSYPKMYHCTTVELNMKNDYLLFSRIRHLMEERHGSVTRNDLEKTLNYSSDYLNRIIKKYSGMSLFDFSMSFCMNYAAECLKNSADSVASIALSCGFNNKTHFYKCFKKVHGMTPNEYRNS